MLRIAKLTDYALIVLGQMAKQPHQVYAAAYLARSAGVTETTVSKICKVLTRANLLVSTRGTKGGYQLAWPPQEVNLARVIYALEGPIALTECVLGGQDCDRVSSCQVQGHWAVVNQVIHTALESITLADIAYPILSNNAATWPLHRETLSTQKNTSVQVYPMTTSANVDTLEKTISKTYQAGFVTDLESDTLPPGLNEQVIRAISERKNEPDWLVKWRLKAYQHWLTMKEPHWAFLKYGPIDYQAISYYSAPKTKVAPTSLEEVDPKLLETYKKLGIPLYEQERLAGVAVDAVFDSISVATTFKDKLAAAGVIFCPLSEAIQNYPDLIQQYLGTVVPHTDNFFAALNSAVFSDGSFVFIPKGVRCPMELSTYFRINAAKTGQFERTLIICEEKSYVSYLEGCTAPQRDENQLHAAVVELIALDHAYIKYSTVQNWYPGDEEGRGGIYNFVTKRGDCRGFKSKISWTQVETGSAITWKYPSCILRGDESVGEFYSVAVTNHCQQADTGTKMIHIGKNTSSTILSKGVSAGRSHNSYRGLVKMLKSAENARNYTQCDSLLMGSECGAHTFPSIEVKSPTAKLEHEATTSKISEDQLFFCQQRGLSLEDAVSMIVHGFCKPVFKELPMEFAVEAQALLGITLEGCVG